MGLTKVIYEVKDKVAFITMNSIKNLNALDSDMINELVQALNAAEEDENARAIVIGGMGKAFSAGGDVGYMYRLIKEDKVILLKDGIEQVANVTMTIKKMSKPVVASVHGAVAGAGFSLALACDFCIAAENANFIQAFVNLGLVPDAGGMYLLSKAVGVNRAIALSMTGKPVSAEEAKVMGFVTEVCAADQLAERTTKMAVRLAHGPALSYKNMKQLAYESNFKDFEEFVKKEIEAQTECGFSDDFKEGVTAFVEKRKPAFK